MTIQVQHDEKQSKFYADVKGGEGGEGGEAAIEYEKRGSTYDLTHTFVPPSLRGQGVADDLARQTLDQIRSEGAKIIPSCRFIHSFLERHPEYRDLMAFTA
jgi:predicted GNAT family acetyltransferase